MVKNEKNKTVVRCLNFPLSIFHYLNTAMLERMR